MKKIMSHVSNRQIKKAHSEGLISDDERREWLRENRLNALCIAICILFSVAVVALKLFLY